MGKFQLDLFPAIVARKCGHIAMQMFRDPGSCYVKYKSDGSLVTKADHAVHDCIVDMMQRDFPGVAVVGEEGDWGQRRGEANEPWLLVDEIDGTGAFAKGVGTFVIMITVMRGDRPRSCAIYDPVLDRMYTAVDGEGAFLNRKRIVIDDTSPKGASIGIAYWPRSGKNDVLLSGMVSRIAPELDRRGYNVTNVASIGYYDALVASGSFSGTLFAGHHAHDTAAGDLLVQEAGGVTTDLLGRSIRYTSHKVPGHIFACAKIHRELLELAAEDMLNDNSRIEEFLSR